MLRGFVSLSAVEKDSAEAYMKVVMALVMSYEFEYKPSYIRKVNLWMGRMDPFLKRFRLKKAPIVAAHKKLAAGVDPNEEDAFASLISDVVDDLKDKTPQMKKELDLRKEDLTLLNDLRLIHTRQSEAAFKRLSKVVTRFKDKDINQMFIEEHEDITDEKSELENLVAKYAKAPGLTLPLPTLQQWQKVAKAKGEKLKDHSRYLELRRKLNNTMKTRLKSLVRSSGKPYLPVGEVIQALKDEGIPNTLPANFIGMVDDAGKFYTTEGLKLLSAPSGEVFMNPEYRPKEDNTYVCKFIPFGSPEPSKAYTENYRASKKSKKFAAVQETMPKLNGLAKKWRADMREGSSLDGKLATILEFIFETAARPGNPNNATQGERTFGATQLQVRHITVESSRIIVKYKGKSQSSNSQAMQKHIININKSTATKLMAKNIKSYLRNKDPEDSVFQHGGKLFNSTSITRYMRTLGFPQAFTVHKFRTARATKMTVDAFKKSPFKKGGDWTERQVNKWVEEQIMKIGAELGHTNNDKVTTSTAIQNYISPEILDEFYTKLGIRPPAKIQKAIDSVKE